jgi:hypothetical protein
MHHAQTNALAKSPHIIHMLAQMLLYPLPPYSLVLVSFPSRSSIRRFSSSKQVAVSSSGTITSNTDLAFVAFVE